MSVKVAVVTGSSSGFGLLTVIELARAGFEVIATMRDPARRTKLDEAITRAAQQDVTLPGRIEVRQLDITKFADIQPVVDGIVRDHGRIDVLVNNAGFAVAGFAEDMALDELRLQLDTNFFGHVAMTKAVLPQMRKQKSGTVIMVSSILGLIGQPAVSSYVASKHALEGWTESVRIELRSLGINMVLVEPGAFATDIWERNVLMCKGALDPASPNYERSKRHAGHVRGEVVKRDPIDVAQLIARIAQDPAPKLRYLIGRDARIGKLLHSLLPWKVWERMVEKNARI